MSSRDAVLAAAPRVLATQPTASMAEIAAAAGVGRATLHRHFASREDLLREIGQRSLDQWAASMDEARVLEAAESGDATVIRACLVDLLTRYVADAQAFGIALTDPTVLNDPELREGAERCFVDELRLHGAAQATGVLRPDVPPRWLGHVLYGLLVAVRDALVEGDIAPRDAAGLVVTAFLEGSGAR
ncbi:TetR/AcrR family transcriptional regulator [Nocardioides caeni]|uniref:TetR/AcrR family transcriptional regulator n=1 Tax=Nocardioides caeni TaxID=574700 RepID=A0A4S8NPB9_9ACTN|nr:TetR/AcrR family transcriptional regulator [Nocardioides caeni]THV18102.1 TetR/AcrR family transcriptional regulator [Nocardioides caeni]